MLSLAFWVLEAPAWLLLACGLLAPYPPISSLFTISHGLENCLEGGG